MQASNLLWCSMMQCILLFSPRQVPEHIKSNKPGRANRVLFVTWLLESIYGRSKIILLIAKNSYTTKKKKKFSGSQHITQHHPYMVWERRHD